MTSEKGARTPLPAVDGADPGDRAAQLQDLHLQLSLEKQATVQAPRFRPKGSCHNCHEPVKGEQLYCDGDCARDHDLRLKRNGR